MSVVNDPDRWSLFGLDLSGVANTLALGVRQWLWDDGLWLRQWFRPGVAVWGGRGQTLELLETVPAGRFAVDSSLTTEALEVSADLTLNKTVTLPASAEGFLDDALRMECLSSSPFPEDDTVMGWRVVSRDQDSLRVAMVIASRDSVLEQLAWAREQRPSLPETPEVWGSSPTGERVILRGFGEHEGETVYLGSLRLRSIQALVALALLALMLSLPGQVGSIRAAQLASELEEVSRAAVGATRAREQLAAGRELLDAASDHIGQRYPYGFWLHKLAEISPDSVYLRRLEFEGPELSISGFADNAADYLTHLSSSGLFGEVRNAGAFTRDRQSGLERFTLTLTLEGNDANP